MSQAQQRTKTKPADWNGYMRQVRQSYKERGLVNLSTYIRTDQAAFLEQVQADHACSSKKEALMLILDRFKEIHEADDRNQQKED